MIISTLHQRWRKLPAGAGPAERDLACGPALLAAITTEPRPALRWYVAREPALVIGSGQKLSDIDLAACAAAGVPVHRRASGGTAVLFVPGLIMQDIALPREHPLYRDDVSESYRWLGELWVETLSAWGVAAEPIAVPAARADTLATDALVRRACFGGLSPYEVLAGGRKLVGFSQVRRRQGALLQVGLYTHWAGHQLAALLDLPPAERHMLADRLAERVVGLDELLTAPPDMAALASAFATALARQHAVELEPAEWAPGELAVAAEALARFAPLAQPGAATSPAPPAS